MTQTRISRVKVKQIADLLGYRLVTHERLGNAKKYYYTYSLVYFENDKTYLEDTTLKKIYDFLIEKNEQEMDEAI